MRRRLRPGRTRTACSRPSTGRTTGTGSSRSATSSATATGSTGCGRATASSCRARQLEQVGGFDESFSMPGGGYANLELYERLGSAPDVTVSTIIGEGSFHQVHGGTTTNQADRGRAPGPGLRLQPALRRAARPAVLGSGQADPLRRPDAATVRRAARSRAACTAAAFADGAAPPVDGPPEQPLPMPDELRTAFIEAVWHSMPWSHTTWLGRRDRDGPDRPPRVPGGHRHASDPTGSSRPVPATAGARSSSRRSASSSATVRCCRSTSRSPTTCRRHPRIKYLKRAWPTASPDRRASGR